MVSYAILAFDTEMLIDHYFASTKISTSPPIKIGDTLGQEEKLYDDRNNFFNHVSTLIQFHKDQGQENQGKSLLHLSGFSLVWNQYELWKSYMTVEVNENKILDVF